MHISNHEWTGVNCNGILAENPSLRMQPPRRCAESSSPSAKIALKKNSARGSFAAIFLFTISHDCNRTNSARVMPMLRVPSEVCQVPRGFIRKNVVKVTAARGTYFASSAPNFRLSRQEASYSARLLFMSPIFQRTRVSLSSGRHYCTSVHWNPVLLEYYLFSRWG